MEENNNCTHTCFFHRHPVLKHLFYGILGLLGAFLAFYVVTDWYFKSMLDPVVQMRRMDKAFEKRDRQMEKEFKKAFKNANKFQERTNHVIRLEQTDDGYKVLVDLVPLNGNEKNVEVKASGHILTVKAAGIQGVGDRKSIIEFTQSYLFGDDVDLSKLKKERKGDMYVITIPVEED